MKAGEYLAVLEAMPFGTLEEIAGTGAAIILSPHPDDETLGCGGLIAALRGAGRRVIVVVITDGAASHPGSAAFPPRRLAALRRAETARAAAWLGLEPQDVIHLDLPDAAVPCAGPEFEAAVDTIGRVVSDAAATSLFATWDRDPHCDHEAVAAMARAVARGNAALRLWSYPIWGLNLPADTDVGEAPAGVRFDITPWQGRKGRALACYASQMTPLISDDPSGFHFTATTLAPFLAPFERFIEERP